ncbi:hypothetical protein [Bifidobacterium sp. ESL0732]|uniref:hypothetical protein n=1 Tax=Bifidobacterium sp. ESL0732 TaxID=2983222 RepID=UPI0023F67589|nr:hypothetical protein [Bifidobacterium sp. ESL0732]WEV64517.1 hypothetical protein OZX70_02755 [Bifidobacterium sp. ESL0732]
MSNPLIDDSQESRGVTADGTPLGVQARLSLSFDETTSEDVTAGTEAWQRVLQAIAGGKVHAEVTLKLEDAAGSRQKANDESTGGNAITVLTFADVPVTLGTGDFADGNDNAMSGATGGAIPTKASLAGATIAEQQRRDEADRQQAQQQDNADDVYAVPRRAIIAMRSKTSDAAKRFRSVIVSLDAVPGNQVEGISPLYHVMGIDSSDASAAVIQLTTKLKPQAIVALLDSLSASHEGAVTLRLVDVEGENISLEDTAQNVTDNSAEDAVDDAAENAADDIAYAIELPLSTAKKQAEILAPWLDMDPDARLDGDPVSFLLAMAPDAARVGKVDDRWILGETQ